MTNIIGTAGQALPAKTTTPVAPTQAAPAAAPAAPAAPAAAPASNPTTALNWSPSDVDLSTVQIADMWPVGNKPIEGRAFSSVGDPHETTGDGLKFDNMERGTFTKLMSASGDFVLQTHQEAWTKNAKVTVNTGAAIAMGDDIVTWETGALRLNGELVVAKPGASFDLPGGGKVNVGDDGDIHIESAKGDKVSLHVRESYIDITGEVGAGRRDGEFRGSLGAFDNDTSTANDLLGREGSTPIGQASDPKAVDAFIAQWRTGDGEDLFKRTRDMAFFNIMAGDDNVMDGEEVWGSMIKDYDVNGDGRITRAEYVVTEAARRTQLFKQGGDAAANTDGKGGGAAPAAAGSAFSVKLSAQSDAKLRKMDKDGDGRVSAGEFFAASGWNAGGYIRRAEEDADKDKEKENVDRPKLNKPKAP